MAAMIGLGGCVAAPDWWPAAGRAAFDPSLEAGSTPATVGALATCAGFYESLGQRRAAAEFRRAAAALARDHGIPRREVGALRREARSWRLDPEEGDGLRLLRTCDGIRELAFL